MRLIEAGGSLGMRLKAGIVVDERSPESEKINNYICIMYAKKNYQKGGRLADMLAKYMNGGMMKYENGGEVSREPKIDYVPNQVQTRGRIVKEQAPGQRPRIKEEGVGYEDEGIFYIDGVPATYEDAKRAFEQTSDFGVGSNFDDYLTKYKKQQGAYNVGLSPQREALRSRSESAGTERLLQALRDMQLGGLGI